ncbi:MAG: hypothetical protein GY950_10065 [bacterium]|nr:hypothetical protein [bacterium]
MIFINCRICLSQNLALNKEAIDDDGAIKALVDWICLPRDIKSNYCRILSYSITIDYLYRLAKRLRLRVKSRGINYVDVSNTDQEIPKVFFHTEEATVEAQMIDKQTFEFKAPSFKLGGRGYWVLELSQDISSNRYVLDHIPPSVAAYSNHELLNTPSPYYPVLHSKTAFRYFRDVICRKVDKRISAVKIVIPTSSELFTTYLSTFGVESLQDEKKLRYEASINMLGGLREAAECFKEISRDVLWYFKDKDEPITFDQIQSSARPGNKKKFKKEHPISNLIESTIRKKTFERRLNSDKHNIFNSVDLKDFLNWLIHRKILMRRILLPNCSDCLGKNLWTERLDLRYPPVCLNCGVSLMLPDKVTIGYLINPLVRMAINEGFIPIILTLRFLKNLTWNGFMYLPGFKGVVDQKNFDIDIIASCDGVLIMCECKNLMGKNPSGDNLKQIKDQFENLIEKARRFKVQVVILSSLIKEYPETIKDLARRHSDDSLSVVLLKRDDLERGFRYQKDTDGDSESTSPQSIRHFLPKEKSPRKKKSKVRDRAKRQIIVG